MQPYEGMWDWRGSLYLSGTGVTQLPPGLTVGGSLYLSEGGKYYSVTLFENEIKIGCETHPVDFWRALDDRGAAQLDGRRAVRWWRKWGNEILKYHAERFCEATK